MQCIVWGIPTEAYSFLNSAGETRFGVTPTGGFLSVVAGLEGAAVWACVMAALLNASAMATTVDGFMDVDIARCSA